MNRELKYDTRTLTLVEVIKSNLLPEVVRVYDDANNDPEKGCRYYTKIERYTELLLQKTQKVKYVHIRVLKYYDNEKMQKEKGPEYVLEHETYVDQEFLIPLKYPGKLNFVHRPGSWRRYVSVAQVLEDLPRYIKVGAKTACLSPSDLHETVYVPDKTILEVVRKFQDPHDGSTYLECKAGDSKYAFNSNDPANFTEVEDQKKYHLFEMKRFMLPKVIMFENVSLEDAILVDKELNSAMLTSMEGPIEVLGFKEVELLVAWARDKEKKVYRTVLMPKSSWNTILVQRRVFADMPAREAYMTRKYGLCTHSDFIEKDMYFMYMDQTLVTWLRDPDFYTAARNDMEIYSHLPIEFPESSDEDDEETEDYTEIPEPYAPPPPLPPHKPVQDVDKAEEHKDNKVRKKVIKKLKKIKSVFHTHKDGRSKALEERPPARPPKPKQRSYSHRDPPLTDLVPCFAETFGGHEFERDEMSEMDFRRRSCSMGDLSALRDNLEFDDDLSKTCGSLTHVPGRRRNYDYADMDRITFMYQASLRRNERALPPLPGEHEIQTGNNTVTRQRQYVSVRTEEADHLFRAGQSEGDFFRYTVVDVKHCFKICGLADFASQCLEQRLDGKFFENYDLEELKKDPFNLTGFQVLKVKKMIYEGWRPSLSAEKN